MCSRDWKSLPRSSAGRLPWRLTPPDGGQAGCGPDPVPEHAQGFGTFRSPPKRDAVADDLEMVEAMISIRALRDRYFECDLFFDPAWSMLIDLYRAELKGQRLSVTSVCIGSGVAGTTALRYVRALENRGYVSRMPDPDDKRRAFIQLTAMARRKLDDYFGKVNARCRTA